MSVADVVSGPVRFARFAMPPNQLGYCGPGDDALGPYVRGREDRGLREIAAGFEGAFPYLRLLAGSNRRTDPLDAEVVEAYWIGNELLGRVSSHDFGMSIDDRFRRRAGADWRHIDQTIAGGVANHAFHVMHVMPWAGLLRDGIVDEPLRIIDRCRISWATVVDRIPGAPSESAVEVLIRRVPLEWSGSQLVFGRPAIERVRSPFDVEAGAVVAVHWDWICERIDPRQLSWLRRVTNCQLQTLRAG